MTGRRAEGRRCSTIPRSTGSAGVQGDPRFRAVPSLNFNGFSASDGHSHGWGIDPSVLLTFSSNLAITLGVHYDLMVNYAQWFNNYFPLTDSAVYTFATLHQNTGERHRPLRRDVLPDGVAAALRPTVHQRRRVQQLALSRVAEEQGLRHPVPAVLP